MANFRCVNYDGNTIWLDIEKVLYICQANDDEDQMQTVIKLVNGDVMTLDENYEELLEDWGIVMTNQNKKCSAPNMRQE